VEAKALAQRDSDFRGIVNALLQPRIGTFKANPAQIVGNDGSRTGTLGVVINSGSPILFDHLVRADEQRGRHGEAERRSLTRSARSGDWARLRPKTRAHGKASSGTCGSRHSRRPFGSMAATSTSRATIRSFFRSSSRREWKTFRPPYMASRKCTILADRSNRFLERNGP
jgi:hypothetical protein